MTNPSSTDRSSNWSAREAERNERARHERLRRDGARDPGENLVHGIALVRFAHRLRAAFAERRRASLG
jgi:hypothetical protein